MKEYEVRLVEECAELGHKINRLSDFLDTDDFACIDVEQKNLLDEQIKIMRQYLDLLKKRIKFMID